MTYIFNDYYIKGSELLIYSFAILMILIIIITCLLVYKEVKKKNDTK